MWGRRSASRLNGRSEGVGRVVRDALLLTAILAGLNCALQRGDAGWLGLNPTPWLLVPLLIGARYGVWSGTISGLLLATGLAAARAHALDIDPWNLASQIRYPLTSLVIGGFLAGELNRLMRGTNCDLMDENGRLANHVERLKAELELARETRQDLQRQLALHNASFACLDDELRRLVLLPIREALDELLHLLHRAANVTSAGFYLRNGDTLNREAVIHPVAALADAIPLSHAQLAAKALEENAIAALTHPLQISGRHPFLAAIPWNEGPRSGVLLIQDMPIDSFDWQNLARVELMLHWTFVLRAFIRRTESGLNAEAPLEDFLKLLAQALETEQLHGLPSAVIRFDPTEPDQAQRLRHLMTAVLPVTAVTTRLPSLRLAALLPFTSDHAAEAISRSIRERLPGVRMSRFIVTGPATPEDLWSQILES